MGGIRERYGRDSRHPSHPETPFYKGISEENGRDGVFFARNFKQLSSSNLKADENVSRYPQAVSSSPVLADLIDDHWEADRPSGRKGSWPHCALALYTLGFMPFILVKKRVNDAVSEKCRRTAISAMGSEVCCSI